MILWKKASSQFWNFLDVVTDCNMTITVCFRQFSHVANKLVHAWIDKFETIIEVKDSLLYFFSDFFSYLSSWVTELLRYSSAVHRQGDFSDFFLIKFLLKYFIVFPATILVCWRRAYHAIQMQLCISCVCCSFTDKGQVRAKTYLN